jgi:hypothetical protein
VAKGETTVDKTSLEDDSTSRVKRERRGAPGILEIGARGARRSIIGLPDAVGSHACECGHHEMRLLPDGVFHCPACGSEVLRIKNHAFLPGSANSSDACCCA